MRERDKTIGKLVSEFGPLTVDHLKELAHVEPALGSPDTLWRRLTDDKPLVFYRHIYVRKAGPKKGQFRAEKYVYADYPIAARKDFEHDLITTSTHVILYKHFDLEFFKRTKEKQAGKINEDAYFALRMQLPDRESRVSYYLESDTGSEPYRQIQDKLERYRDMLVSLESQKKSFFVLFVCATEKRAQALASLAGRMNLAGTRRAYLFTSLEELHSNSKGQICLIPDGEAKYTLLPTVGKAVGRGVGTAPTL